MNTLHVKKGDTVTVITGNDKGKSGTVTKVYIKQGLVLIEGVGARIKHQKPRKQGQAGQKVTVSHPISASNVAKKK